VADDSRYLFVRCGTPGYVAPEIINIKDMNAKSLPISDVFSAGCIFYYITFGKHLFTGKTGQEIIAANRECDTVLSGGDFERLSNKEVDLMRRMLQREPEMRISAAQALRHPYLTDTEDQVFIPRIMMRQNGSCPLDLITSDNEAAAKFITSGFKGEKKDNFSRSHEKLNAKKKMELLDPNKSIHC
jgi:serine/threonine protein kinase